MGVSHKSEYYVGGGGKYGAKKTTFFLKKKRSRNFAFGMHRWASCCLERASHQGGSCLRYVLIVTV